MADVERLGCRLVEVTGGEPLAQPAAIPLMQALVDQGYQVLLETGGSESVADLPRAVHCIMDLKAPGSGMVERNRWENLNYLKPSDEIKIVIASREDFDWARQVVDRENLDERFRLLLSPAFGLVQPADLVDWMLAAGLTARLNLQIHKYIWSPKAKGV
jgi:7-carboxy-7-deazaguanine synthase